MSERKLRSDAGKPRGPRTTQRREFMLWFAARSAEERQSIRDDMELVESVVEAQLAGKTDPPAGAE